MRYLATALSLIFFLISQSYAEPLLKSGDRVTFLGGTFIERMQIHGHFEAEIRCRMGDDIRFRNLGWAGDNVLGESRAVFGDVKNGMERLLGDMKLTNPTVIIICYGGNEAHAGIKGIEQFKSNLQMLTANLDEFSARYIFLAPRPYENLGPPLPTPQTYNKDLKQYRDAIKHHAASHHSHFIDLGTLTPLPNEESVSDKPDKKLWINQDHSGLTSNGVHLTSEGYRRLASSFCDALNIPLEDIQINPGGKSTGVSVVSAKSDGNHLAIEVTPNQNTLAQIATPLGPPGISAKLTIDNLRTGKYRVTVHDILLGTFSQGDLAKGVEIRVPISRKRIVDLRDAIVQKNMMFFHRHRPQNETYLFLFRKHEQGNNASEIPKFDPIVEDYDRRIHRLSKPVAFTLSVTPAK